MFICVKSSPWLLTFCFIALLSVSRETESSTLLVRKPRIIHGEASTTDMYRWVVSLQARKKNSLEAALFGAEESFCGGTLINKQWILTAAHCVYTLNSKGAVVSYENPKYWHIRFENDLLKPNIKEKVKNVWNRFINRIFGDRKKQTFYHAAKVFKHPNYVPGILEHDIALIKVKEDLDLGPDAYQATLPIPAAEATEVKWPQESQVCTVLGWGCGYADGPPTERVQELKVPVLSGSECRKIYVTNINLTDSREFCAGYFNKGKGICPGDSGGPLACELDGRLHLAGVVSATHAKKPSEYPGLFTRVSYYAPWIRGILERN